MDRGDRMIKILDKEWLTKKEKKKINKYIDKAIWFNEMSSKNINIIHKNLKIHYGKSIYGESFVYTDSNCFRKKFRISYKRFKYSKELFENISKFEYEMNEFHFAGDNALLELFDTLAKLIIQLKIIENKKYMFYISIFDDCDSIDEINDFGLSFIEARTDEMETCNNLSDCNYVTIVLDSFSDS